ncbi:MAG: hypothetical protein GY880_18245, partial [Planctomycetaceae bacterium]|nr:hypothetical protein [Planctomycetaceae bacterium]
MACIIYGTHPILGILDMVSTTSRANVPKVDLAANGEASGSVPALDRSLNILELLSVEPFGLTL